MNDFLKIAIILKRCGVDIMNVPSNVSEKATDVYLSSKVPVTVFTNREQYTTDIMLDEKDIEDLFFKLCDHSVYKHIEEIKRGFIVINGAYRCGICGTAVISAGVMSGYKNITSLNIRVPRKAAIDEKDYNTLCKADMLYGVLVVGEPSSGKTTVLKHLIRMAEEKYRVSVLDERYELSGDINCDVLLGTRKSEGMPQLIRTMSPQIVVCDEIDENDLQSVEYAMSSGVSLVATAHGNVESNVLRPALFKLLSTYAFKTVVQLESRYTPGRIKKLYEIEELNEVYRFFDDSYKRSGIRAG